MPAAPALPAHDAFKDPKNDVVLRCGQDGAISFPYRKLYLKGASEVFEDMALVGDGARKKDGATGLDIITLADDDQKTLAAFLIFANPRVANPHIKYVEELQRRFLCPSLLCPCPWTVPACPCPVPLPLSRPALPFMPTLTRAMRRRPPTSHQHLRPRG